MQHKSLFAALLCGALCLTACLKNEESPSVTQVRNAKAELLLSEATLNKANAEAALIQAKAEEKVQAAEAKLREAEAKVKEADAIYRLAEADKVKAETQLKLVEVKIKEIDLEIKKVQLESDKVELERQKAELLAQKAEYEATIAYYELAKQEYEYAKLLMEKELEAYLLKVQADLLDAQLEVAQAQKAYDDFLASLAKEAEEAENKELDELRKEAIRLSNKYHAALRDLIDMEEAYVKAQYQLAALENELDTATEVKNELIAANKRQIARNEARIATLEKFKEEYLGLPADFELEDIKDYLEALYAQVQDLYIAQENAAEAYDDAEDKYSDAYDEFAHNFPIRTQGESGIDDTNYVEAGIVYDYTDALFTADDETGVNLNDLDVIDTYVDYGKVGIYASYFSKELGDNWHSVNMVFERVTDPKEDEIVPTVQYEEIELYRYYQEPIGAFGIKNLDLIRYPELPEGIAEDRYEWENWEYILIENFEFVPMVVKKEGFDKYIALRKEVLNDNIAQMQNTLDGMNYISDWYVKTFGDAVKSIEKANKEAYAKYKAAIDANDAALKAYYEAYDAYLKACKLGYEAEAPEQSVLIRLEDAIYELQKFLAENKGTMDNLQYEINQRQSQIDANLLAIEALKEADAEFKANPGWAFEELHEREYDKDQAQAAYDAAKQDYETKKAAYEEQQLVTIEKNNDKVDAYQKYFDANNAYNADPTPENLAVRDAAWNAYDAAYNTWYAAATEEYTRLVAMNNAQIAMNNADADLISATNDYNNQLAVVNQYTDQIAVKEAENDTLQEEIDVLNAQLNPYLTERATLAAAVDTLEAEWKAIDTANKATAEWAAVEAAEKAIYFYDEANDKETGTSVDLQKAEDAYSLVLKVINRPRYFNEDAYEEYTDPAFPALEDLEWWDLYDIYPEYYDTSADFESLIDNITMLFGILKYIDAEPWTLLGNFYDSTVPMSMADMVEFYHYFTDSAYYPYVINEFTKAIADYKKEGEKKIGYIQARLDKVMDGEAVYNEGIENANKLYKTVIEKEEAYFDASNVYEKAYYAWSYADDYYDLLEAAVEDGGSLAEFFGQIDALKAENAALKAENEDFQDLKDKKLVIKVLNDKIAVMESEIETQEVIVETWKKQLDEVMDKISEHLPEAEEIPAE